MIENPQISSQTHQEDEITLKDLIVKIKEYGVEVRKNWKTLVLFVIPITAFMLYKAITTPITYISTLTFMVNENEGGMGMGAAAGILGMLGAGGEKNNLDKILELSKSQRILNEALLTKVDINGKNDFYINHIINIYDLPHTDWVKDPEMSKGVSIRSTNIDSFSRVELSALKSVYNRIVGSPTSSIQPLYATSASKQTSIMKMSFNSLSEELSVRFLKTLYDRLNIFYVSKSIEKQKYTYEVVVEKADSIKKLLYGREYAKASYADTHRGIVMETQQVPTQRLTRDVNMLSIMYAEAIKNAEVADFSLKNKVPFVQAIDIPMFPLKPEKTGKTKATAIGIALGLILGILFIVLRRVIREAM
jgi:hypothetical protein